MPPARKPKNKYSKSFNACKTCKLRRVKCDETLPHCRRCTSTGRKCEGPGKDILWTNNTQAAARHHLQVGPLVNSHLAFLKQSSEKRSFHYYLTSLVPFLSGALGHQFWAILLPQLASEDHVVRNGMLAMSLFVEKPFRRPDQLRGVTTHNRDHVPGLNWYSEAVTATRKRINHETALDRVLACTLFAAVEMIQLNYSVAIHLIRTGFCSMASMLTVTRHQLKSMGEGKGYLAQYLLPTTLRCVCMFATSWHTIDDSIDIHTNFDRLSDAVYHAMSAVQGTIKDIWFAHNSVNPNKSMSLIQSRQPQIQNHLMNLQDIIEQYCSVTGSGTSTYDFLLSLEAFVLTAMSWHEFSMQMTHIAADTLFTLILEHAEMLLTAHDSPLAVSHEPPAFLFETAVLPIVWFVTLVAPDACARYKAFTMMHEREGQRPNKEGNLTATVITRELEQCLPGLGAEPDTAEGFDVQSVADSSMSLSHERWKFVDYLQIFHVVYEDFCERSTGGSVYKVRVTI